MQTLRNENVSTNNRNIQIPGWAYDNYERRDRYRTIHRRALMKLNGDLRHLHAKKKLSGDKILFQGFLPPTLQMSELELILLMDSGNLSYGGFCSINSEDNTFKGFYNLVRID